MKFRDAMKALYAIEAQVEITDPEPLQVAIVYPYLPASNHKPSDFPCFMHNWGFEPFNPGPNGLRQLTYTVRIQVAFGTMQFADVKSDVATAFHDAFVEKLCANLNLNEGGVQWRNLRSAGEDTLVKLAEFIGLEYFIDLLITDTVLVGP